MTDRARRNAASRLALILACMMVFAASVQAFVAEYRVVVLLNGTTNDLISGLSKEKSQTLQLFGARTTRDLLVACGRTVTFAPALKADAELAVRVSQTCNESANSVLKDAPSNARALAISLLTSKDIDYRLYQLSQFAAPYEPWVLNIRLYMIARESAVPENAMPFIEKDVSRALLSDWGKRAVARLYRDRIELRPAITRAAEEVPAQDQADFVNILRGVIGSAG